MWPLLLLLALLACLAKCWTISRRPTTNRKCVGSLMVLLVGWITSIALSWSFAFLPQLEALHLIIGVLPTGLIVGASLLAISGLKDYSRSKGFYRQGQGQAFTTLVLSGLFLALIGAMVFGGLQSAFYGSGRAAGGRPLVFEELNFKFLDPGKGWSQVETNDLDPKATLAFRCKRPEIYFLIVAQKAPSDTYSIGDLLELAMRNLSNTVATLRVTFTGATYFAGKEWMRVHSEASNSEKKFHYEHRLLVFNGRTYQLIVWGTDRERIAIAEEAEYLVQRFTLLEAPREARRNFRTTFALRSGCLTPGTVFEFPRIHCLRNCIVSRSHV